MKDNFAQLLNGSIEKIDAKNIVLSIKNSKRDSGYTISNEASDVETNLKML